MNGCRDDCRRGRRAVLRGEPQESTVVVEAFNAVRAAVSPSVYRTRVSPAHRTIRGPRRSGMVPVDAARKVWQPAEVVVRPGDARGSPTSRYSRSSTSLAVTTRTWRVKSAGRASVKGDVPAGPGDKLVDQDKVGAALLQTCPATQRRCPTLRWRCQNQGSRIGGSHCQDVRMRGLEPSLDFCATTGYFWPAWRCSACSSSA